jgi:hypothetical protein
MASTDPKQPQGKFEIEITKREIRKDLPTVNVKHERECAFESGAGIGALVVAAIALLIIVALIMFLKH